MKNIKKIGFTLAEVLITLSIIGVVSAIVIPTVIKNYNDRKYNTARLKALKTFGEAGKLASINGEINGQPTARAFVENVLSKYLKITKVCDKAEECGFPSQIQPSSPTKSKFISNNYKTWESLSFKDYNYSTVGLNTRDVNFSIYIKTVDGFSAKLFYNPKCVKEYSESQSIADSACMHTIYDMNGVKKPNNIGEDVGLVTTFWSGINASSVAPGIVPFAVNRDNDNKAITTPYNGHSSAQAMCADKGTKKIQYSLPNIDELSSLYLTAYSLTSLEAANYWSGSKIATGTWIVYVGGKRHILPNSYNWQSFFVYCVRR